MDCGRARTSPKRCRPPCPSQRPSRRRIPTWTPRRQCRPPPAASPWTEGTASLCDVRSSNLCSRWWVVGGTGGGFARGPRAVRASLFVQHQACVKLPARQEGGTYPHTVRINLKHLAAAPPPPGRLDLSLHVGMSSGLDAAHDICTFNSMLLQSLIIKCSALSSYVQENHPVNAGM